MLSDHEYKLLFKEMMSVTNEGFIVIDANGVVQDISDVYCDFLDRPYHEIVGRPIEESISTTSMYDVLKNRIRGDGTEGVYIQPYSKDDNKSKKNVKAAANRFCFFDERGNLLGAAASVYFKERSSGDLFNPELAASFRKNCSIIKKPIRIRTHRWALLPGYWVPIRRWKSFAGKSSVSPKMTFLF